MLDNTVGKAAMVGHQTAATTFQIWTGMASLGDFRATKAYRISEAGDLIALPQNGEFKFAEQSDEGVTRTLLTYGAKFGLTRQAIINDDLDYVTKKPAAYARAARRGVNTAVYAFLNNNPAIYDSVVLFHAATHGNLTASGQAPSVASLNVARAAMMRQKDLSNGAALNIAPEFLIAPPDLFATVGQLVRSIADPDGLNSGVFNPEQGGLTPVFDAALTNTTAWFAAANPNAIDTIEVAYLNGRESPILESQASWDTLGIEWRIYHDYAVTVLDYRGLYKNTGTGGSS
jgi:hypothetical protein